MIKPGTVSNEIFSHQDMLPTLVAAAGEPDIVEKCKKGHKAGNKTFKVHLDGFNLMPHLKGEVKANPRPGFLYWGDEGDLMALRYGNWKIHFAVQRYEGVEAWQEPLVQLRFPHARQPAHRSLRGGGISSDFLLEVAGGPGLYAGAGRCPGRAVHADHDGVPATPESGELEPGQ